MSTINDSHNSHSNCWAPNVEQLHRRRIRLASWHGGEATAQTAPAALLTSFLLSGFKKSAFAKVQCSTPGSRANAGIDAKTPEVWRSTDAGSTSEAGWLLIASAWHFLFSLDFRRRNGSRRSGAGLGDKPCSLQRRPRVFAIRRSQAKDPAQAQARPRKKFLPRTQPQPQPSKSRGYCQMGKLGF